jgi:hypothetical protein
LKISRLDLDGASSPSTLVARILEVLPDLPIPVPVEDLCERFDIQSIGELHTAGFEVVLVTDRVKSSGAILVAKGQSRQRRRFSIGHELGHFLIPAHRAPAGMQFICSTEQFGLLDVKDLDRRRRMEAEANRFAALLLMPPPILRAELRQIRRPEVADIIRLASLFDVSKDAIARAYVDYSHEAVAIVVIRDGRVQRFYRNDDRFPWIDVAPGKAVPEDSIFHDGPRFPGTSTQADECAPELWLGNSGARKVDVLTEQVLHQQGGHALLMLYAELSDDHVR